MAKQTKNTNTTPQATNDQNTEQRAAIDRLKELISVKIHSTKPEGNTRARLSLGLIDEAFIINSVRLVNGKDGPFLSMPARKVGDDFKSYCYGRTPEMRQALLESALDEYNQLVQQQALSPSETKIGETNNGQAAQAAPAVGEPVMEQAMA